MWRSYRLTRSETEEVVDSEFEGVAELIAEAVKFVEVGEIVKSVEVKEFEVVEVRV